LIKEIEIVDKLLYKGLGLLFGGLMSEPRLWIAIIHVQVKGLEKEWSCNGDD
jgi:hypothetical protein